ncbi:MAG: hypothetical protein QM708_08035 [Propioniciclava sp.]|uniref:ETEC_3214 domain-containing protein n=1 Tax=Propioniciclava sp. TaxID=2038686 RepID=UPI0039E22D17
MTACAPVVPAAGPSAGAGSPSATPAPSAAASPSSSGTATPGGTAAAVPAVLHIDSDVEDVTAQLGAPAWTTDACEHLDCTAKTEPLELSVYQSQGLQIRVVTRRLRVVAFTVTALRKDVRPSVTWLDHNLGKLGQMTFADVYQVTSPPLEPTDTAVFKGPRDSIYVDIVSTGAPGDYQGLILALAPGVVTGDQFADYWWGVLPADGGELNLEALSGFRSGTSPDTFGVYMDDGDIATLFGEADNVQTLLAAGKP